MEKLVLDNIFKVYDDGSTAVSNFNLRVQDQEFIVLVGPSGCGKSTTLRMIAGLEEITTGELRIEGKLMNDVPPKDRDIAMVFQNYALYPHMNVYDNMAFGLKLRKFSKAEIDQRVKNAADILGLQQLLDKKPKALSGGQRQRVALGRAIVRDAKLFLMDEPLSNLDAKLPGLDGGDAHGRAALDTTIDVAVGGAVQTAFTAAGTVLIPIPGVGTAVGVGVGIIVNSFLNVKFGKEDKSVMDHIKGWFH